MRRIPEIEAAGWLIEDRGRDKMITSNKAESNFNIRKIK
jgi:hypothetical protein